MRVLRFLVSLTIAVFAAATLLYFVVPYMSAIEAHIVDVPLPQNNRPSAAFCVKLGVPFGVSVLWAYKSAWRDPYPGSSLTWVLVAIAMFPFLTAALTAWMASELQKQFRGQAFYVLTPDSIVYLTVGAVLWSSATLALAGAALWNQPEETVTSGDSTHNASTC